MKTKYSKIKSIIFPNKKINYSIVTILFLGIIAGSIYSINISEGDKQLVIEKVQIFISNISNQNINTFNILKNSISINIIYSTTIYLLGMTIIGALINVFILFLKGFIFGFSLASFIITYSYKGIILSILYTLFGQLLNLITVLILTIYSIMFVSNFIKQINQNKTTNNIKKFTKNYSIIFIITIIINIISSLFESFIFTPLIKLIIKLFV